MIRQCKICGKEFDTNGTPAKCCSKECMKENNRIHSRETREKQKNIPKKPKKSNRKEITNLAVEAKKHGMSYGQYVAQMYMKGSVI